LGKPVLLAQAQQLLRLINDRRAVAARRLGLAYQPKRMRQGWRGPQFPRQGYGLFFAVHRLRRISERPLHDCINGQRADGGIVPKIDVAMMRVAFFVIERQACIRMLAGLRQHAADPSCRPRGVVRLQQDFGVVQLTRDPEEISRNLVRPIEPAPAQVQTPQICDGWREVGGALESTPNLGCPLHGIAHLRRRAPVHIHQSCTEPRQDRQLGAPALGCLGLRLEKRQGAAEVFDPFAVGGTAHRLLAGLAPIDDRFDQPASILQMMRYDFRRNAPVFIAR
jgi:hypothetical protein